MVQAAEAKAKENAEAAIEAIKKAKDAGTYKAVTGTIAERIAAMQKASDE